MAEIGDILALERAVWEALVAGDAVADAALLEEGFVGLYSTGFAGRDEHAGQLADGPTVARYRLSEVRLLDPAPGVVLLAYRADYLRVGGRDEEAMYVSSVWRQGPEGWRNLFSQDTAVGGPAPV